MGDPTFEQVFLGKMIDLMFTNQAITMPTEFHERCSVIKTMLENDLTGLISPILDFAVDSGSEAEYRIECKNSNLETILNNWIRTLNAEMRGTFPTGIKELAKEYLKERWEGSSLCVLRAQNWKKVEGILLPQTLFFVNGAAIEIPTPSDEVFKLGSYEYYLDKEHTQELKTSKKEVVLIQKPFSRWHDQYPVPYLIKTGVYKNFKGMELMRDKGEEVVSKILPYLLILKKGTDQLAALGKGNYTDEDMKLLQDNFKEAMKQYKQDGKGKLPMFTTPFDTDLQHFIPDLTKIMTEDLYKVNLRSILSGLGFIDVVQGVASTRKESVLNPKPFVSSVNAGVTGFKMMLFDLMQEIVLRNEEAHSKYFSEVNTLRVVTSPLKMNIEALVDFIRSGFDRGAISIQTYIESLGFDFDVEKERREYERKNELESLFYPHLIQNQEATPDEKVSPSQPRKTNVPEDRKKGTPEAENFRASLVCEGCKSEVSIEKLIEESTVSGFAKCPVCLQYVNCEGKLATAKELPLVIAPYNKNSELPPAVKKLPESLQTLWREVFNETYKRSKGDEEKCFRTAWYVVNKQRKAKSKASEQQQEKMEISELVDNTLKLKKIEILKKQEALLNKFLEANKEQ
jgi:cation transport regulator ChaB